MLYVLSSWGDPSTGRMWRNWRLPVKRFKSVARDEAYNTLQNVLLYFFCFFCLSCDKNSLKERGHSSSQFQVTAHSVRKWRHHEAASHIYSQERERENECVHAYKWWAHFLLHSVQGLAHEMVPSMFLVDLPTHPTWTNVIKIIPTGIAIGQPYLDNPS